MNFEILFKSRPWLVGLILVNLVGFLFGIYYYWTQLSATPFWLWLFVLDCPLYVLLFSIVCGLILKDKLLPNWLVYLTSVGLIKYGIWTGLVIWLHLDYFFSASPILYVILFVLHIGMILEGIILIPRLKASLLLFLPLLGWFLLNDWLDYFAGLLPIIPKTYLNFLMWESFIMSFLLIIGIFLIKRKM